MQIRLKPSDWPCTVKTLPPGVFVWRSPDGQWNQGFKSEYRNSNGAVEIYNEAGEYFCGADGIDLWPCTVEIVHDE